MVYAFLRKKRVFALLLAGFLLILFYNSHWMGRWMYPVKYEREIRAEAATHGVDPFLVAAVIRVESNFSSDKVSGKGAVGLMQIMPDTAKWIAEQPYFADRTFGDLTDPELNIEAGVWYLASLQKQFGSKLKEAASETDRIALIAAAYNAGPGNVSGWLGSGRWDGRYETVGAIPFGETRHYVERIVYYHKKYQRYYKEIWRN